MVSYFAVTHSAVLAPGRGGVGGSATRGPQAIYLQLPQLLQLCLWVTYFLDGGVFDPATVFTTVQLFNLLARPACWQYTCGDRGCLLSFVCVCATDRPTHMGSVVLRPDVVRFAVRVSSSLWADLHHSSYS